MNKLFCGRARRHDSDDDQPPEQIVNIDQVTDNEKKEKEKQLFNAIRNNDINAIKTLIDGGLDVKEVIEGKGSTALHCIAETKYETENNLQDMLMVFLQEGCSVNSTDLFGHTPLQCAAEKGNMPILRCLLKNSADVNHSDKTWYTPLHCAAKNGMTQAVMVLLHGGAKIDMQNNSGETPLYLAVEAERKDVVLQLLCFRANRDLRDKRNNFTPLGCAKMKFFTEIAELLTKPHSELELEGQGESVVSDSPEGFQSAVAANSSVTYNVTVNDGGCAIIGDNGTLNINQPVSSVPSQTPLPSIASTLPGASAETSIECDTPSSPSTLHPPTTPTPTAPYESDSES